MHCTALPNPLDRSIRRLLAVDAEHPEADIEGAARVDNRIYWITSHGRNKDGKERPSRYALFATDIVTEGRDVPALKPTGKPYRRLAYDIMFDAHLRFLGLEKALRVGQLDKSERKRRPPKKRPEYRRTLPGLNARCWLIATPPIVTLGAKTEAILFGAAKSMMLIASAGAVRRLIFTRCRWFGHS